MIQQQSTARSPVGEAGMEQGAGRLSECTEYITSNPGMSVAVSFALGLGTGLLLTTMLRGSSAFSREETLAERISHRVADSLREAVPSSWMNAFKS